jgi:uncharacterized protein YfaS (alpha-2-macroglobulin family)
MRLVGLLLATGLVSAGAGFLAGRAVYRAPQGVPAVGGVAPAPAPPPSSIAVRPVATQAPPPAPTVAASGVRALNILRIALDAKGNKAQACLVFSGPISAAPDFHPADYLRIEPALRPALQVDGARLCLGGLGFGVTYQVTVLAGLPGADGTRKLADETLPLSLGDLPANTDFADDGFILSRDATGGLPIATINVSHVHLRVDRITDRVLVRTHLGEYEREGEEYDRDGDGAVDRLGAPVWEGDLAVKGARNEKVTTAFPLAQVLPHRLPGAYRISLFAKDPDSRGEGRRIVGERWVFDTDLMLTTLRGADGLHVFVRSLTGARPVGGAQVSLLAANNDELGRVATDTDGRAVFAAGLLRGAQGLVPRMVMAYAGDDFTALQLDKPGFDFSDRGVEGRAAPGPVDGFLYADRGIYRPGETIQLATVVRDDLARPLPDGQAVTVVLHRPDGVEATRVRLVPNAVGLAVQPIPLKPTSPRGTWRLEEMLAGTKTVIGTLEVQVQDFVPNRLAVELAPRGPRIGPGAPATIDVASRYLYGAPASDLQVSAHVQLQRDTQPVAERGWVFGRQDEALNVEAQDIAGPSTDAQGHAALSIDEAALKIPQTSAPLRADVTVGVAEPGGRATESRTTLKVVTHDVLLGLRAANEEAMLPEDRASAVAVGAWAPDGTRLARGVAFRLVEQVTEYNYFAENGHWAWKTATHDRPVTFGTLDVPATEGGAPIFLPPLAWGTYRLEVSEAGGAASGAFASLVLHVGSSGEAGSAESPEKVAVSLQGPAPAVGQTATLHVKPPFAGQMLITVENSRVLAVQTASIPAEGADVTVRADAGWGVGAYVMASVYRPSGQASGHAPVRAVGLAYVKLDASARTIGVAMAAPAVLRPRSHVDLPVTVSGTAAGGQVWLTLAAVDEGILDLTRFASPDPDGHYFGKRRLAVDVRDDYAHLIDGNGAAPGEIRAGGDLDGAGLTVVPTRTTALFSGLVAVGADGHATIGLDLPDFTGGLRLMAVAVSAAGFGHAERQVPVRDPVVAQLSTPRFLAPGDEARLTLLAHNVEAPPGTYHVHLSAEGALSMPPVDDDIHLDARQAVQRTYPLTGGAAGTGRVVLVLRGPGGMDITHDWPMEVRTPFQSVTRVSRADQAPGEAATLSASLAAGLQPAGATLRASFSTIGGIDLPGLLAALDEYPFGCSEQLVSRAMPLIYVEQEARLVGGALPPDLRSRVQDAVDKLLERQDDNGAFGLWRAGDGEAEPFLGAMIADFLTRAQAHGYAVPQHALDSAMRTLARPRPDGYQLHRFWSAARAPDETDAAVVRAGRAYALLLAARTGQDDAADLRYMNDNDLDRMEPLGRAQLAAGLSMLGDRPRAVRAFDLAEAALPRERPGLAWRTGDFYRTRLRDTAAMVSLAAEIGDRPRVQRLLAALDRLDTRTEGLTTQEQGWLVIAAGVLLERAGPASVSVDGSPQKPAGVVSLSRDIAGLRDITVLSTGAQPLARIVSVRGLPTSAPPAMSSHVSIAKSVTASDGAAVDLGHLAQNQRLVVHLSGAVDDDAYHQAMLVDPLPAGFEIERVVPASTEAVGNGLPWVGPISPTRMAEKRDDRFMAAIDFHRAPVGSGEEDGGGDGDSGGDEKKKAPPDPRHFNLAYVVRVVSPGRFVLPAASIRDMYRPDVQARTDVGAVSIATPH